MTTMTTQPNRVTTTEIKHDPLRNKVDAHVLANIHLYVPQHSRENEGIVLMACEWREEGLSLSDIRARFDAMESDIIEEEIKQIMEEEAIQEEIKMKAAAEREGFGPAKDINPYELDKMSDAQIQEVGARGGLYDIANDLYYLHF